MKGLDSSAKTLHCKFCPEVNGKVSIVSQKYKNTFKMSYHKNIVSE